MTFEGRFVTAVRTRSSCPMTSGALPMLFMSRTTVGCVLYFFAIDATVSPLFTL